MELYFYLVFTASALVLLFFIFMLKSYIRPKFPVRVTCWFCGETSVVPYGNRDCWDCLKCDQYNGFDKSGDYNKPIPAQYDERLNHSVSCKQEEFISGHSVLCEKCSQGQLLKVKQLANFVPYDEKTYDKEAEAYERHLEKVYKLCLTCQMAVQRELEIQNEVISKCLQNHDLSSASFADLDDQEYIHADTSFIEQRWKERWSIFLHIVSLLCAVCILLTGVQLDTNWTFLHPVVVYLDSGLNGLALAGLFMSVTAKLTLGKNRLHIVDALSMPVWLSCVLIQLDYLRVTLSSSRVISVVNILTTVVCLTRDRQLRNRSNISVQRLSLDPADQTRYSSASSVTNSQFSSVSQPSKPMTLTSHPRSAFATPAKVVSMATNNSVSSQPQADDFDRTDDLEDSFSENHLDNTLSSLDGISIGTATLHRSESGIFSTASQASVLPENSGQSVSHMLRNRRPLISPAKLSSASGFGDGPPSSNKYGLFSLTREKPPRSFHEHPSTPSRTTLFGATPFTPTPLKFTSATPSQLSSANVSTFSSASDRNSFCTGRHSSLSNISSHKMLSRSLCDDDSDDERFSGISQRTSLCAVDSTTMSVGQQKNNTPLWKSPGVIGFLLGASIVANVSLGVFYFQHYGS